MPWPDLPAVGVSAQHEIDGALADAIERTRGMLHEKDGAGRRVDSLSDLGEGRTIALHGVVSPDECQEAVSGVSDAIPQ